jgi:hypothetical protein
MQLSKKDNLGLFIVILFFWSFPTIESINRDARGAQDLSATSQLMLYLGLAVLLFTLHPLFLWIWNGLKKLYRGLANWLDGR